MRCALTLALVASLLAAAPVHGADMFDRAKVRAKAAGCVIKSFSSQGAGRTEEPVKYASNPPTSGPHHPEWPDDGVYAAGDEPQVEKWVHALEHGRVIVQYRPGTTARRVRALTAVVRERFRGRRGYHQLLLRNNTGMRHAVAAVVWRRYLGCPRHNARVPDRDPLLPRRLRGPRPRARALMAR